MTPALKPGDRAVFRSSDVTVDRGRNGATVTVVHEWDASPRGSRAGRTPVRWPDGSTSWPLTRCLTLIEPPKPARRTVDEGDLRAVAIGLGMKAADVETLLTLTAVVSAARAS